MAEILILIFFVFTVCIVLLTTLSSIYLFQYWYHYRRLTNMRVIIFKSLSWISRLEKNEALSGKKHPSLYYKMLVGSQAWLYWRKRKNYWQFLFDKSKTFLKINNKTIAEKTLEIVERQIKNRYSVEDEYDYWLTFKVSQTIHDDIRGECLMPSELFAHQDYENIKEVYSEEVATDLQKKIHEAQAAFRKQYSKEKKIESL